MPEKSEQDTQEASEAVPAPTGILHSRKARQIKSDLKGMAMDDIVGAKHWKRSKFGAVTGFSIITDSLGKVSTSASDSFSRVSSLYESIVARDEIPEVPDEGTPEERFDAGLKLYGLTELQVSIALRNTFWSTILYAALCVIYITFVSWSVFKWPPESTFVLISRFGPLPVFGVLLLKHAYTNWVFRTRRLGIGVLTFLFSGNYMPKMS